MFGFTRYNYDRFRREMLQSNPSDRWSRAPEPGDEAPNFELLSLAPAQQSFFESCASVKLRCVSVYG